MRDWSAQRGEGKIGFLIAIIVIGIAIFVSAKIIPVRISAYEFKDFIREQARYAAIHRKDAEIVERIMEKAQDLEIPLSAKNLDVRRTRTEVIITANYEQPVDLKFHTYVYKFAAKERAPLF